MNKKITFTLLAAFMSVTGLLAGCHSTRAAKPPPGSTSLETRNNCYSLLHQLLSEQKDVSILRFIKFEHSDVKDLVKRIASTSGAGAALLEKFAQEDPSIRLDDIALPPGEVATRDSIASTKKKELLGRSGDEFQLTLLLTQTEALSYAWHLAEVASENEPQPDRARALAGISADMQSLYREVFGLLLKESSSAATASGTR
jgi:hypothetical protein